MALVIDAEADARRRLLGALIVHKVMNGSCVLCGRRVHDMLPRNGEYIGGYFEGFEERYRFGLDGFGYLEGGEPRVRCTTIFRREP